MNRRIWTLLLVTLAAPVMTTHAAQFCVGDATTLAAALNVADSNGQDDFIQIRQGTRIGSINALHEVLQTSA